MNKYCKALELDKVLVKLADFCSCEDGKTLALNIEPLTEVEEVKALLEKTVDANTLTNRYGTPSVGSLINCTACLKRAQVGSRHTMKELLDGILI